MATIKDVAKMAGVAVSTASYALNGKQNVSPDTRRKVEEAARGLNYKKSGFASDLKRNKTNTIALILSDLSGPFYSELIKGVQDVATANGYDLIACSAIGGKNSTAIKFLTEKRTDSAIILANNINDEIIKDSARNGFPIVVLDRNLEEQHIVNVSVDNEQGGFIATEYLIQQGHEKIAYVSGPTQSHDNQLRYRGFKKAMNNYNLPLSSKWDISGNFTRESGYQVVKMILLQNELPTAIFFANDEMALGAYEAFEEKGIKIPDDISIIGFDDILLAQYATPALTTIRQPKYDVGSLAAHLSFQAINGNYTINHHKLSTELVVRNSVRKI